MENKNIKIKIKKKHTETRQKEAKAEGMQGGNCANTIIKSLVLGVIFMHVAASTITTYFQ